MKKDIILCGVGGQGILSIATIIAQAATSSSVTIKQAEVHGMSQRGGDVQSHLRLSTSEIHSDLIPRGAVDLIISMEPMEALRYAGELSSDGVIVTSSKPFVNIPDYPSEEALDNAFAKIPRVVKVDIARIAGREGNPKGANIVLLGHAAGYIDILSQECLREAVRTVFSSKGEEVVNANLKCFDAR